MKIDIEIELTREQVRELAKRLEFEPARPNLIKIRRWGVRTLEAALADWMVRSQIGDPR